MRFLRKFGIAIPNIFFALFGIAISNIFCDVRNSYKYVRNSSSGCNVSRGQSRHPGLLFSMFWLVVCGQGKSAEILVRNGSDMFALIKKWTPLFFENEEIFRWGWG